MWVGFPFILLNLAKYLNYELKLSAQYLTFSCQDSMF